MNKNFKIFYTNFNLVSVDIYKLQKKTTFMRFTELGKELPLLKQSRFIGRADPHDAWYISPHSEYSLLCENLLFETPDDTKLITQKCVEENIPENLKNNVNIYFNELKNRLEQKL